MRPRIVDLKVDELEWKALGADGLYSRLLSRDEETGARTALQRVVPEHGYSAPDTAHFHHTYEEIITISGHFSFDSRNWLREGAYVYHPPCTVHGFASAVKEETTFLSRVGQDLDFNYVPEPEKDEIYHVEGKPRAARDAVAIGQDAVFAEFGPATFLGQPVEAKIFGSHPETGEGTALVRLPAGWEAQVGSLPVYLEMFVMHGLIDVDAAGAEPHRAYFFYPPGDALNALSSPDGALVYVNYGGPIGL